MKKYLFYIACLLIILLAFRSEKQYAVKFTAGEVFQIMQVVDQSKAPHDQVKAVQELFNREMKQYVDSTGRLK